MGAPMCDSINLEPRLGFYGTRFPLRNRVAQLNLISGVLMPTMRGSLPLRITGSHIRSGWSIGNFKKALRLRLQWKVGNQNWLGSPAPICRLAFWSSPEKCFIAILARRIAYVPLILCVG